MLIGASKVRCFYFFDLLPLDQTLLVLTTCSIALSMMPVITTSALIPSISLHLSSSWFVKLATTRATPLLATKLSGASLGSSTRDELFPRLIDLRLVLTSFALLFFGLSLF